MNVLFESLLSSLAKLGEEKAVRSFKIDHKRKANGDVVVALIIRDRDGPFGPDAIPSTPADTSERGVRLRR